MKLQDGSGPLSASETRLRQERDLYWRLLNLGNEETLDAFLQESLNLVTELSGAKQGYIELRGQESLEGQRWRIWHGLSEAELNNIESRISTGIMAEALSSGQTVVTPAAFMDPRFKERGSVRMGNIGAVLCAPIGGNARLGALYLHAEAEEGGHAFSGEDRKRIELFAKHAAPFAERLIEQKIYDSANDATSEHREKLDADGFIGKSPAIAEVLKQITLVAPLDVSVLLTGPTGTGKSVVAKLIHENGNRKRGPFVELNCANLPAELIENELFGAMPGAHSTAHRQIAGKIEAANGGTLFLDEIAELSMDSQAKLLQLLQTKHYFPLGTNKPVPADIRLISATNVALEIAMKEGRFREDLFYRLQVLPIELPALSRRKEDLPLLASAFVERACEQHGIKPLEISRGALTAI
ncbi:MAG: sigma 54-interacting transcriptional regulator, partial [Pseudomonadota bacterium]